MLNSRTSSFFNFLTYAFFACFLLLLSQDNFCYPNTNYHLTSHSKNQRHERKRRGEGREKRERKKEGEREEVKRGMSKTTIIITLEALFGSIRRVMEIKGKKEEGKKNKLRLNFSCYTNLFPAGERERE